MPHEICAYCHAPARFTVNSAASGAVLAQLCALHLGDWCQNDLTECGAEVWNVRRLR